MKNDLTRHVLAVMAYGLSIKDRIADDSQALSFEAENAKLVQMLQGEGPVLAHPDYGDDNVPRPIPDDQFTVMPFLGVRYALTCWLDEIFISDPRCPWSESWRNMSLEHLIYGGTQQRAWRFWKQAALAEKRPGGAAGEAFLWCVMLGFRGAPETVDSGMDPKEWLDRMRRQVLRNRQGELKLPAERGLDTSVPPLRGKAQFKRASRFLVLVGAAALFAITVYLSELLTGK
jgi:type VI secretion system protein ImpK